MTRVVLVSREELDPLFGYAQPSDQIAYVRQDLPECVRNFVTVHELYHLRDRAGHWVWGEIKANAAATVKHPLGFIVCVLMSLTPHRIKYYWKRITAYKA